MANVMKDFVVESSTTTGTGSLTLDAAINNMKRFSDVCSVGDDVRYIIKGVDGTGTPTGEWEVVQGKYSAANTLTRVTVIASSNAGSLVNFSAGTKQVYIGADATMLSWVREKLTAARTYYVRTDGSDSNNGLSNTSGGAFLTIQKAVDVACASLDTSTYTVTIQVADGTYTGAVYMKAFVGAGSVVIQGNNATPSNVVISTTSATAFANSSPSGLSVLDMKIQTTTGGYCLAAQNGATLSFSNIVFGAAAWGHIYTDTCGSVSINGNYSIVGGAPYHIQLLTNGVISCYSRTVTLTGTPAFSAAYLSLTTGAAAYYASNTFTGSATGKRYDISLNGVATTAAATLPGNVAGTTATGGQYA